MTLLLLENFFFNILFFYKKTKTCILIQRIHSFKNNKQFDIKMF